MAYSINKQMTCQQARHLVDAYILNDPSLTIEDRKSIESHLQNCSRCAQEYEKAKWVMNLVKKYWSGKTENQLIIERTDQPIEHRMTAKEDWKDLLRRCPDLAVTVKYQKRQRLLYRVSAVAACLVIGVSIFLAFPVYSKQKITPKSTHQQVALAPKPSVRIELVSKNGNILIPAKQQIASNNELKTLVINGKHRLMMNTNTVLAVEPLVEHSNIGCLVTLDSGQIYTHVQHDGNPFIVDTANGKAVITGTTFDIKATEDSTTLVVSEGKVQFESENGVVNVAAGQTSEIVDQSAPSIPLSCNTAELTAWATGYKPGPALAQVESNTDLLELSLSFRREPIILEETDYESWVEQKRNWFKREFPHIFRFKEVLAKEGVKVDYPELLIKSGDIWRLEYPEKCYTQLVFASYESMAGLASAYGKNEQWVSDNLWLSQSRSVSMQEHVTLKALERWAKALEAALSSPQSQINCELLTYSLHASAYLYETRILAWLIMSNNKMVLTQADRVEIHKLLYQEIDAINTCVNQSKQLFTIDYTNSACDEYKQRELLQKTVNSLNLIAEIEMKLQVYRSSIDISDAF